MTSAVHVDGLSAAIQIDSAESTDTLELTSGDRDDSLAASSDLSGVITVQLRGAGGDDVLSGGAGDDVIEGGAGEDDLAVYPGETIDDVLDQLLSFGPQLTAVSLGGHGATLASATHRVTVPAPTVDVVDTVGAGDTFTAALIDALLTTSTDTHDERYLRELGNHAASAAAITVQRARANLPTRTELHTPT